MSEYQFVEKPFLDQLAQLGWQIIQHVGGVLPQNPGTSLRSSFREVTLKEVFKASVRAINTLPDGRPWLTDAQLEAIHDELIGELGAKPLLEANEAIFQRFFKCVVERNEVTGEEFPEVKLIDWVHPERNRFIAINQFRVDTPGRVKSCIIPDLVLFVNGLPWVVVECKDEGGDPTGADPMTEAFDQLMRYSDQRDDPDARAAGLREGEPRLFHFNQLLIRTCGKRADLGALTATDDQFFYPWKEIYPPAYQQFTPPLGEVRAQEILIQGVLPPATLLDIVRHCVLFMDAGGRRVKIVPRYQQYRAMLKIVSRLQGTDGSGERSGVVWHTQGSGKSLTMVFTVRKLRTTAGLQSYKVLLVNDRTDLEDQLTNTAQLIGEPVKEIEFGGDTMRRELSTTTSNVNMVMVHKFQARANALPDYVQKHLTRRTFNFPASAAAQTELAGEANPASALPRAAETLKQYQTFEVVNASEQIVLLIDEAHRTQSSDMGDNLFAAFPNAARIAFTGTPLITERHGEKRTVQRFGTYIDRYKLMDAVEDKVTLPIRYVGKTAAVAIPARDQFERKFENLFSYRTPAEISAIKKKYGTFGDILEAEQRIAAIAEDIVEHYITHILPDGFKAQVVASSKLAATRYQRALDQALATWLARAQATPASSSDSDLIQRVAFLKTAVVVSSEGTNELAVITAARQQARELNAVENFKKPFDYAKPETGLGIMVVCDMLLTGFDAPVEQVMYLDKRLREHGLLQAIARVNRVAAGKERGYVVDYIGLAEHLSEALQIYAGDDEAMADVLSALRDIRSEAPTLDSRYTRLLQFFTERGVREIQGYAEQTLADPVRTYTVLEAAVDLLADIQHRATFDAYLGLFLQSLNVVLPHPAANPYKIPAKRFGYLARRVRDRYKDTSVANIAKAGAKVRQLINEHLISEGIDPKIPPTDLLDPAFLVQVEAQQRPRAKASEMEHAIRRHCKIHLNEDPVFYGRLIDKLEAIIQQQAEHWEAQCQEMMELYNTAQTGRREESVAGVPKAQQPFYDLVANLAFAAAVPDDQQAALRQLIAEVFAILRRHLSLVNFWDNKHQIGRLTGDLNTALLYSGIDALYTGYEKIVTEIVALARHRHRDIIQ